MVLSGSLQYIIVNRLLGIKQNARLASLVKVDKEIFRILYRLLNIQSSWPGQVCHCDGR
jgi:hypothetical protein